MVVAGESGAYLASDMALEVVIGDVKRHVTNAKDDADLLARANRYIGARGALLALHAAAENAVSKEQTTH